MGQNIKLKIVTSQCEVEVEYSDQRFWRRSQPIERSIAGLFDNIGLMIAGGGGQAQLPPNLADQIRFLLEQNGQNGHQIPFEQLNLMEGNQRLLPNKLRGLLTHDGRCSK